MKILAVCQNYWPEPFNVSEICEELARRGHEITVLTGVPNVPTGKVPEEYRGGKNRIQLHNGVTIIRVPIVARGQNLKGLNKVRRVLNYVSYELLGSKEAKKLQDDFDRVIIFQYSPVLMALPGLKYSGDHNVPALLYCYDLWPEDLLTGGFKRNNIAFRIMKVVSRNIYVKADTIAITSSGFSEYLSDYLNIGEHKIQYLPQFAEAQFERIADESHDEGDVLHLLFAGNIGANQSVQTIIRAAAMLPENMPVIIDIVGSGSQFDECQALANDLGASKVIFHGSHPFSEMSHFYNRADGTIITLSMPRGDSKVPEYTLPRKLQSYMAIGRPVLASVPGESKRVIEESGGGLAVGPEDASGLASLIIKFAQMSQPERSAMGSRVHKYYLDHFSRERFYSNLEEILIAMEAKN